MNKKLLVFFHPKGADKNFLPGFVEALAGRVNAEILTFNAPFEYEDGYMWFGKKNEQVVREDFDQAVIFASQIVSDEVKKRNISFGDVIYAGNSQGGFMAVFLALKFGGQAIALCSDVPYELQDIIPTNNRITPIFWVEGGKDTLLTDVRKQSYKILQDKGCNLYYMVNANSTHTGLDLSIIDQLA